MKRPMGTSHIWGLDSRSLAHLASSKAGQPIATESGDIRMYAGRAVAIAAGSLAMALVFAIPVSAAVWTIEDGACDGVAYRYTQSAKTGPTTYAPCSSHSVKARIQPPSSGGVYWTSWKTVDSGQTATWSTTGAVLDSQHSVAD